MSQPINNKMLNYNTRLQTPNTRQFQQKKLSQVVNYKQKNGSSNSFQHLNTSQLLPNQKTQLLKMVSFIKVLLEAKLLQTDNHFCDHNSHLFKISSSSHSTDIAEESPDFHQILFTSSKDVSNIFNKEDLLSYVLNGGYCMEGREEEFLDAIVDLSNTPLIHQDNDDSFDFTPGIKELLYELNIDEYPVFIKKSRILLGEYLRNKSVVSDEQRKKIDDFLKDSEEDDEQEEFEFDYADI